MGEWTAIKTQADIEKLMQCYGGFHDSCLVGLEYRTGAFVDSGRVMCFGLPEHYMLHMCFHSQWEARPLELCFSGVRRFCAAGWQERYGCDIFECSLQIHTDLLPGRDDPLIVWADNGGFSPKALLDRRILDEPMTTYVIASSLKWRFTKE